MKLIYLGGLVLGLITACEQQPQSDLNAAGIKKNNEAVVPTLTLTKVKEGDIEVYEYDYVSVSGTSDDYGLLTLKVRTKDGKMRQPLTPYQSKEGQYINNFFGYLKHIGAKGLRKAQGNIKGEEFQYYYAHTGFKDELDIPDGSAVESIKLCLSKRTYDSFLPFDETQYPFQVIEMIYYKDTELGKIKKRVNGSEYYCEEQDQ